MVVRHPTTTTTAGPTSATEPDWASNPVTCQVWPDEYGPGDDHPASDLVHVTALAEHHEVTFRLAVDASLEACAVVWDDARQQARRWLDSQGLEVDVRDVDRYVLVHHDERNAAGEVCAVFTEQLREVGVEWAVVVGQGTSEADGTTWDEIATRQHWTWSARWSRWHAWFAAMAAPAELALRLEQWCDPAAWPVHPVAAVEPATKACIEIPMPDEDDDPAVRRAKKVWADFGTEHGPNVFGPPRT